MDKFGSVKISMISTQYIVYISNAALSDSLQDKKADLIYFMSEIINTLKFTKEKPNIDLLNL